MFRNVILGTVNKLNEHVAKDVFPSAKKKQTSKLFNLIYLQFFRFLKDVGSYTVQAAFEQETPYILTIKATAGFIDFGYYNSYTKFVPIATGHWDMTFPLNYADSTRHFAVNQKIKQDGETIIIKKADVSPVGFYLEFEIRDTGGVELKEEMLDIIDHIPLELVLADGIPAYRKYYYGFLAITESFFALLSCVVTSKSAYRLVAVCSRKWHTGNAARCKKIKKEHFSSLFKTQKMRQGGFYEFWKKFAVFKTS